MLNAQDIQNAQIFLNRVDLKGNEAMAMAELLIKLQTMQQELQQQAQQQALQPGNGEDKNSPDAPPPPKAPTVEGSKSKQ